MRFSQIAALSVRWAFVLLAITCSGPFAEAGFVSTNLDVAATALAENEFLQVLEGFSSEIPQAMVASVENSTSSQTKTRIPAPADSPPFDSRNVKVYLGITIDGSQSSSSSGGPNSSASAVPLLFVVCKLPADLLVSCLAKETSAHLPPNLPYKLFRPPKD